MRNDAYISALQCGQATYVQPQFNAAVIEAFEQANPYSTPAIIMEYTLPNTTAVSIRLPAPDAITENETFGCCVRYTENSVTYRYLISKPIWFDGILFPVYTGQKLGAGAVIEIWSLDDIGPAVLSEDVTFYYGPLVFQAPGQIATGGQIQATTTTLTPTVI